MAVQPMVGRCHWRRRCICHWWTWYGDRVADGLFSMLYSLPVVCKCRCLSPFRKERRQKNGITLYAFSGCSLFDELLVNRKDFLVLREGDAVNRQYKGSMTVEAAVVVPMVIFILAAVIYLCFFLHDRAVLQSYSLRQAESTAWEKEIKGRPPVFMVGFHEKKTDGKWLTNALDVLGSRKRVNVSVSGSMKTRGAEMVTGGKWQLEKEMCAVRVNYTQDRLVTVILRKGKK